MAVTVGVRQLRENLRAFLDRARAGEEIIVTEHGLPVATITGVGWEATFARLVREGVITPAQKPREPIRVEDLPPMEGGSLSDLVIQERREGY